jgi:glycosyltransferase involved in cell wall biosynthesis
MRAFSPDRPRSMLGGLEADSQGDGADGQCEGLSGHPSFEEPALSVVIPVRNGADELPVQLQALAVQEFEQPWEVVVVDNGSTDRTADVAASFQDSLPHLRIVSAHDRAGRAHARNCGIASARGSKILFVDADDEVAPGYVGLMARALDQFPFVASRLDPHRLNPEWMVRSMPISQESGIGDPFGLYPAPGGGTIGVRREVLDDVGEFDPAMRHCEDIDFGWRARRAGFEPYFVSEAVLYVRYRASLRAIFRQSRGYGTSGPILYRRYRDIGMPRRSPRTMLRFWLAPFVRLLRVRDRADIAAWVALIGFRVGLLQGCISERVLYL